MAVDPNMYVIKPFFQAKSFDEMVKPLTLAAAAYKEQEAKLEDMTDKASALEWIANRDPNSQTAALYREMSDKIQGIRDDIMMNGFHGGIRPSILDTRKIYSANSAEITRRYNDMVEYQKRMEQLSDKDNSMVFSMDSQNISIDDFAGGRRPKIKAISGNEIMTRGAAAGKRFTSQIFGDGIDGQAAGDQFWRIYKEQGMTDDALWNALEQIHKTDKYKMLKDIMDNTFRSFNGFSDIDRKELENRWKEGFYAGSTYNRDVNYTANPDHMTPMMKTQQQLAINQDRREQAELDMKKNDYNFMNGFTSRETWIQGDDGKMKQVLLDYDPYTGEMVTRDINTKEILDHKQPPSDKKKEKPKQPKTKRVAVTSDGSAKVNINDAADEQLVGQSTSDYYVGIASVHKQYPEIDLGTFSNLYNLRKARAGNKDIYIADPKINPIQDTDDDTGTPSTDEPEFN